MKPFDLKAVFSGEKVVALHHGLYYDARIICFDRKHYDFVRKVHTEQIGFLMMNSKMKHEDIYWADMNGICTMKMPEGYNMTIELMMFEEVKDYAIMYAGGCLSGAMTKEEAFETHSKYPLNNKVVKLTVID